MTRPRWFSVLVLLTVSACSVEPAPDTGGGDRDGGVETDASAEDAGTRDAAAADVGAADVGAADVGTADVGTAADVGDAGPARTAADWIREHFVGAAEVTGDVTARTAVETPALVHDLDACCAKYAFDVRETAAPDVREVGFVNVTIHDLESTDAFGAGIQSSGAPSLVLFLANVSVVPNWPLWVNYASTNYDGIVLDGSSAIYAEDLTIRDWNADGAIDNKAPISQFVRLTISGRGNRGIRYWEAGPHYLVDSHLTNEGGAGEGSLMWFSDCDTAEVRIWNSTFNDSPTVPASLVSCGSGSAPNLVYLTTDPRTTGEMHEMFTP